MNQYIIVGTLGQGAFGKVKLVLNSADMNLYAVKLLSKGSLMRHQRMRPRTATDFQVEAQRRMNVIRLLHHPNIICPFEVIGTSVNFFLNHSPSQWQLHAASLAPIIFDIVRLVNPGACHR